MSFVFCHDTSFIISFSKLEDKRKIKIEKLNSQNNFLKPLDNFFELYNTSEFDDTSKMFEQDIIIPELEDFITKVEKINTQISSLISLPDISKWKTSKTKNMSFMFSGCDSLKSLPDISKWQTKNVHEMAGMFAKCSSLISLPNNEKWNI